MGIYTTVITGTILATGKTFTHGLGTTPDIVIPVSETSALATGQEMFIKTFNSQVFVIGGAVDGLNFRAMVMKLHSIIQ